MRCRHTVLRLIFVSEDEDKEGAGIYTYFHTYFHSSYFLVANNTDCSGKSSNRGRISRCNNGNSSLEEQHKKE